MKVTELKAQMHMQKWEKLIADHQDSGISIKLWCQQNKLHEGQYYYYLKKLRLKACEGFPLVRRDEPQFALVPNHAPPNNSAASGTSNIKVTFSNAVVEIAQGAEEAQVRLTLEVLLNAQ